jgi:hypothetical protein
MFIYFLHKSAIVVAALCVAINSLSVNRKRTFAKLRSQQCVTPWPRLVLCHVTRSGVVEFVSPDLHDVAECNVTEAV